MEKYLDGKIPKILKIPDKPGFLFLYLSLNQRL